MFFLGVTKKNLFSFFCHFCFYLLFLPFPSLLEAYSLWPTFRLHHSNIPSGFPGGSVVKNLPVNVGDIRDVGLILGSGRFPGGGNGNPLQYSCLEDPMDRKAWWSIVYRVTKSQTRLKQPSTYTVLYLLF